MTTSPRCRAEGGPAHCTSTRCPARREYIEAQRAFVSQAMASKKVAPPTPFVDELSSCVLSGGELNANYTFYTRLLSPFDPAELEPVANTREGLRPSWTKPLGGLWLATGGADGRNDWDSMYDRPGIQYRAQLQADARVLTIKWRHDHHKILGLYSREVGGEVFSIETGTMRPRIGLDYEELAKHYDAVFLTDSGLRNEGARQRDEYYLDEVSLSDWEIQSVFIMNPEAVSLTVTGS